jgi:two-component system, cell cycle sensor histidine kinase and response regulator CckA
MEVLFLVVALLATALLSALAFRFVVRPRRALVVRVRALERAEAELAHREEGLRLAMQVGLVGTWDDEFETKEAMWSDTLRELYGFGQAFKPSYEAFLAHVHPNDREDIRRRVDRSTLTGETFEYEYRFLRPDGETRWMLSRGRVLLDENGVPARQLGAAVDITARKQAEEERETLERELRQAQKLQAIGRLAGGIAHDFNNILLGVRGYADLARDRFTQGEDPRPEIAEVLAASARAGALTRQLLAFSRKQVLKLEVLDLNEVVAETERFLHGLIGDDVELEALVSDAPVCVSADRSQLEQVIVNLAVNARDAMAGGGRLTLEVRVAELGPEHGLSLTPGRYALLAVSDTGCGMDVATTAQIFEPFFTTKAEGTGLGLATVHGIVKQTGGTAAVYTEVGEGTTFKIYLPLAEPVERVEPVRVPVAAEGARLGETVVLVEDETQVREIVAHMLEQKGYGVFATADPREALEFAAVEGQSVDLLLTDMVMPHVGGRELAERFQQLQPEACVLYMSGYTEDVVIRRGGFARGAAFIEKPFDSQELAASIRLLLDDVRAAA